MPRVETLLKITSYLCALTGFAAVARYLDPPYIAGFALFCAAAVMTDLGKLSVLPRWCLNLLSVIALVPPALRIGPDALVEPVLNGLVLLLGIKLLEDKKARDYLQIYLLCMFLLIGSALVSFGIVFLVYFLPLFLLSTYALLLLACLAAGGDLRMHRAHALQLFRQALIICCISVPACAFFFMLLPRTDFPLFTFWNKAGAARSGFTDSVTLGEVAEIQEDSAPAFRAEMDPVGDADLYWRGIELDRFDGVSWRRSLAPSKPGEISGVPGGRIRQTIYLEPSTHRHLFALDRPVGIYPERVRRWKKALVWADDANRRIRYRAVSVLSGAIPEPNVDRQKYLELPRDFPPRIVGLVRELVPEGGGREAVRNLMAFLRSGRFAYSLENLPGSGSPLEEFLFESRSGNCEYFASALGAMLRSAGVPSRLVGGYRGGYYNPAGSYYLVLQKNAHVWVEAHDGAGWARLDPTPSGVQPGQAINRGLLRVKLLLDTFNYYWDKFVISYDLGRQLALWRDLKSGVRSPLPDVRAIGGKLGGYAWTILVLAGAAVLLALLMRRPRRPKDVLLGAFARRMDRRGYRRHAAEGLEEFVARIADPSLREKAAEFVNEFQYVFYRDRKFTPARIKRLKSCIRAL